METWSPASFTALMSERQSRARLTPGAWGIKVASSLATLPLGTLAGVREVAQGSLWPSETRAPAGKPAAIPRGLAPSAAAAGRAVLSSGLASDPREGRWSVWCSPEAGGEAAGTFPTAGRGDLDGVHCPDLQRGGPGTAGSALAPGLLATKGGDGNAAGGAASSSDAAVFALLLLRSPKFFSSSLERGGK